jgi:uncharacterized membrane protein HdeD (DUF308 family)
MTERLDHNQTRYHTPDNDLGAAGAYYANPLVHSARAIPSLRRATILRGVLATIIGMAILALLVWRPMDLILAFGILAGAFFAVLGVIRIILGIVAEGMNGGMRALNIVFGLLVGVIGLMALVNPGFGLLALAILIGVAWIFEGVAALSMMPPTGRGAWIFFGIVALLAGLVIVVLPWASIEPLIIVTGVLLVVLGIADFVGGIRLREAASLR